MTTVLREPLTDAPAPAAAPPPEDELIRRCLGGAPEAFSCLVARYRDRVFNAVLRICRSRDDAEEIAQEAFLTAYEKLAAFRGVSSFYTWLFRIAVNRALSRCRKAGRMKTVSLFGPDEETGRGGARRPERIPDPADTAPDRAAADAETARLVAAAVGDLDPPLRAVVVLRDMEDMKYREIAGVLGIPAGTVKSRLHEARRILRQRLSCLID